MRNPVIFSIFLLFLISCRKDKYTTIPQLKFKSVNKKIIQRGENIVFTLSFTDKEGDLSDKIMYRKVVKNCTAGNFVDSSNFVPSFPAGKDQAGELIITLRYIDINPQCAPRSDTAVFKFVLRDKAKNLSDTAVSDQIIILN